MVKKKNIVNKSFEFEKTVVVDAKLSRKKKFDFTKELKKSDLEKGMKATFRKPHIVGDAFRIIALYKEQGKLEMSYFISSVGMRQIVNDESIVPNRGKKLKKVPAVGLIKNEEEKDEDEN